MPGTEMIPGLEYKIVLDRKQLQADKEYILCACMTTENTRFAIFTRNPKAPNDITEVISFQNITEAVTVFSQLPKLESKDRK